MSRKDDLLAIANEAKDLFDTALATPLATHKMGLRIGWEGTTADGCVRFQIYKELANALGIVTTYGVAQGLLWETGIPSMPAAYGIFLTRYFQFLSGSSESAGIVASLIAAA